jgi:hypothetical protein
MNSPKPFSQSLHSEIQQKLSNSFWTNTTHAVPKVMPPIYFHGNYNRYKSTITLSDRENS